MNDHSPDKMKEKKPLVVSRDITPIKGGVNINLTNEEIETINNAPAYIESLEAQLQALRQENKRLKEQISKVSSHVLGLRGSLDQMTPKGEYNDFNGGVEWMAILVKERIDNFKTLLTSGNK